MWEVGFLKQLLDVLLSYPKK